MKNKKNINIRVNINNNDNQNKMYYKIKNKPLTSSTSGKKNVIKINKKDLINSTDRKYMKIKIDKNKNNWVQYKFRYSDSVNDKNNIYFFDCNNSNIMNKEKFPKKKEIILKKRKYGDLIIDTNNLEKKMQIKPYIKNYDNIRDKSTKNKNNIIIYNNLFKNENKDKLNFYNKVEKHKINTSASINKTIDKIKKNYFYSKNKKNIEDNKSINNISNLTKRKSYVVPSIKVKKRKKVSKEKKIRNETNINTIYNEENKMLFISHLIESKQIEYLKNYEKYRNDSKDKLIKKNKKKMKIINDDNLIDKLMSSDEEINDINDINIKDRNKTINYINENIKEIKNDDNINKHKNKNINLNIEYNYNKNINENIKKKLKEKLKDNFILEENKNILAQSNYYSVNLKKNENNDIFINNRKPKINTLEYLHRINNNIDVNKLITSISCLDLKNNKENINSNEANNNINTSNNNEPESISSVNVLFQKKNIRPKEEITNFMKNNKLKLKHKEIKLKKERNEKILKKFKNFVELQKNIKKNKNKIISSTISPKYNTIINKNTINSIDNNYIRKTYDEFHLSQNGSSLSSSLNQQEVYLSIYDAQKIYSTKDNKILLKNKSMVIDNNKKMKFLNINKNKHRINKTLNKPLHNNTSHHNLKKLNNNEVKLIKNVIHRLNKFLKDNTIENSKNNSKNKKYKNKYNYILKNSNRFIKEIHINDIKKNKNKKIDLLINKKQPHIPVNPNNEQNFKNIPLNAIKKIINHSHNNIYMNKYKLDDYKKNTKNLSKNHSGLLYKDNNNNSYTKYIFTNEQLKKYKEIFNYTFIYMKLFIQKNIFNHIITYINIKYKYISGFNQLIFLIKKNPFNYLRIIQQREYYQVILRQFYLPYLNKAFNAIKKYVINIQKFYDLEFIIKQIYYTIFFKRMFVFIQMKENYILEKERIIEEEKDEGSYESNSKNDKSNNKEILNSNNNNYNSSNRSSNKENNESYDETNTLENTFNIIIKNVTNSQKKYVFNIFKTYYLKSKNKNIDNNKNNDNQKKELNLDNSKKDFSNKNKDIKNEKNKINYNKQEFDDSKVNQIESQLIKKAANVPQKGEVLNLSIPDKSEINNSINHIHLNTNNANSEIIDEELNLSNKLPIKKDDFEKYEPNKNKEEKKINLPINQIELMQNIHLKKISDNTNKRYIENDDIISNEQSLDDNNNLEENKNENILSNIPKELEQQITDNLTNEIINELFQDEIKNKYNLLKPKKTIKKQSNNSITNGFSKENISIISNSPGRKNKNLNNSQAQNMVANNNDNNQTLTIVDENSLNNSVFMRTIYEIKKEKEINYYEESIFPELLNIIEKDINKNYINIINNLKKPLKKNDEEIMNDLSNLITYENIANNSLINYKSRFYNENIIKKEYIDKKILNDFNNKIKNETIYYEKYFYQYLNQCIYDTTNEIIKNKRMYGNIGEPLLWSLRSRKIEYKFQNTQLFQNRFVSNIIKELKKIFFAKIGAIIENSENLNISQFSKERDIKFNEDIREILKKENDFEKLDEQETVVKIMISKVIMNQLLNEVIEILEHIQNSRNNPEKYNYKSIFSCDNIPLLSIQNSKNEEEDDEDEDEEEKSEDKNNQ